MRLSYFHTKQRLWLLCGGIILCLSLALAPPLLPAGANPGVEVAISDAPAEVDPDSDFVAKVAITQGIVTDLDVAQFDITYDKAVLHVTSVVGGEIGGKAAQLGTWGYIPAGTEDTGRIRVICNQPMPTPENTDPWPDGYGYLVELHFDVVGNAGSSTTISFPEGVTVVLGDKNANPIPVDEWVNSGTVTISPALAATLAIDSGISGHPDKGYADETTFSFIGTASGGTPPYTNYEWDFNYDGTTFDVDKSGAEVSYSYTTAGTYTIGLRVTDSLPGGSQVIVTDQVTVYPTLVASCTVDLAEGAATYTEFTFTDQSSGGTDTYTCAWTFGDGESGAGTSAKHTYSVAPTKSAYPKYTFTLTVTDELGTIKTTNGTLDVYKLGDANGDYDITVLDVTTIENIIMEIGTGTPGSDANKDALTTVLDITATENIIMTS
jgi:hypothetical protein